MEKIQCIYDYIEVGTLGLPLNYYQCCIGNQTIPLNNFCLEGEHKGFRSNNNVRKLLIVDCNFTKFPKDFQKMFPNITSLYVQNCVLDKIKSKHIGKFTKLTEIIITNCDIKSLKGDTFRGLTQLESINLSNNLLEEIEPDDFDGLEMLKRINLRRNKNIDKSVYRLYGIEMLKEEIKLKCKPKNIDESRFYLKNKIKEFEKENQKLTSEIENKDQTVKDIQAKKDQLKVENTRLSKLETIMTDPAFKDFTINIDDSSFKVHKFLFAARSETLAELLRNNPEATELNLRDIPEKTFKAVHDFIYTNQLPEDDTNYLEVFAAANRLKIVDLVEITANHLLNKIDENNSMEILELSNKFNHEKLREKAFENIRTKIFPGQKINDDKLAKNTEKIKKLIEMKKMFEEELENE